jgi:aminopeptidase N
VTVSSNGKVQTATVTLDSDKQQATFSFSEELPAGKATLSITYTGILNNELRGFYLSKTTRRNYAVTQFESTDARRAFPCFDEPAFKATYDVSLIIGAGDTAISNGPIVKDTPGPGEGKHTLRFATTPRMSTYLVAFLVGDFQCTGGEQDGVAIRVCSTPDKVGLTPYALGVAKYVLHYYNNYFGIRYPLKKLDLVALPDFEAGAMENFGAITYRESELLLDPRTASFDTRKLVAVVVAHEMAHQWFGDLVTMQWWDNLWLNEGFATWMENKSVGVMHPDWDMNQSVADDEDETLDLDAQATTRAIRARADTPDEINEMFDGIAYGKAGDVLLMVENYLGEKTFRKGVHTYLSAHLYANATAEDFWNAQTATSHKPVDKIMESLVAQPGVPILTFGEPAGGTVSVSQRRFFLSPSIQSGPAQKWTLPVCFKAGVPGDRSSSAGWKKGEATQECTLLTPADSTLKVPVSGLFFANAGGKGYYRTAYPPSVYAALVAGVETSLAPTERISLLGNEWAQLRANKATVGDYLDLTAAVRTDPNSEVINQAIGGIDPIYSRIAATPEEKAAFSAWICKTFAPVYARISVSFADESWNTQELRAQLFELLGGYGKDPAILARAKAIAEKYVADPASLDPALGDAPLTIAVRSGDAALFDQLQKIYETSANPEVQRVALRLLSQFEDPALVKRSLEYATSSKVRNQDAYIQFELPLGNDETRDLAWQTIKNNWDKVQAQFTVTTGAMFVESTGHFCTAEARDDVAQFFAGHKVAASDAALKRAIDRINGCIEFRALQEPNLKQWLANQSNPWQATEK